MLNCGIGWVAACSASRPHAAAHPGHAFAPAGLVMGVPWQDTPTWAASSGSRSSLNEFVAYSAARGDLARGAALDPRSVRHRHLRAVRLRELLSHRHPDRRHRRRWRPSARTSSPRFGLRALIAGTLANFMTACFAGMLPVSAARHDASERGGPRAISVRGARALAAARSAWCWARAWAPSPQPGRAPPRIPYARDPALPHLHRHRPQGRAGARARRRACRWR